MMYHCHICGYEAKNKRSLQIHVTSLHKIKMVEYYAPYADKINILFEQGYGHYSIMKLLDIPRSIVESIIKGKRTKQEALQICRKRQVGENCPNWKGGRINHNKGYIWVKVDEHPYASEDGYVLEHRLVMEKYLGRYLLPEEVVHHKDKNKKNNDIGNLELTNKSEHMRMHK